MNGPVAEVPAVPDPRRGIVRVPEPAAAEALAPSRVASLPAGHHTLHVSGRPAGLVYVPRSGRRWVVVLFHGAGGDARQGLRLLLDHAEEHGLVLLAPDSVGRTWDLLEGGYGPDVVRLQGCLDRLLPRSGVVGSRPVLAGFSDGASYAVSLGLINGAAVQAVLAFSPGFAAPTREADRPSFFVSHGVADRVLPVQQCSRRVVGLLRRAGYVVRYREFDGGHEVPAEVTTDAMAWLPTTQTAG